MIKKMSGESSNITEKNIEYLKKLFPEILTEGKKIDFDMLKTVLGESVEAEKERYQFTWNGKKKMIIGSQKPSKGTLRPDIEKSENFDTTGNLYIEGDNLEVMKLLEKSYNNKFKLIFIDPPYNTGSDFVYKDNFSDTIANYLLQTKQIDDNGDLLITNTDINGRIHTNWLNMIYPRILKSRGLLSEDGIIAVAIDDNEYSNLKKVCDEIFGEHNFVANIVWKHTIQSKNDELHFSRQFNNILVYAKNKSKLSKFRVPRTEEDNKNYSNPDNDSKGMWRSGDVRSPNLRPSLKYVVIAPDGQKIQPPKNGWRWSQETLLKKINTGEIIFKSNNDGIIRKIYLEEQEGRTPENLWDGSLVGTTRNANQELKRLFNEKLYFDTPKPVELIKKIMSLWSNEKDYYVLDYFSGSATTAHAVMKLNAEDGGSRKFVMIQLPEQFDMQSEAYIDGYRTICDVGEERIRRAGEKIKKELSEKNEQLGILENNTVDPDSLDIGFKVLKLDTSNIREWNVDFTNLEAELDLYETPFVNDRSELDIVYEIMLKQGLELTYPIETFEVENQTVYDIAFGSLFICLSKNITQEVARAIIKRRDEKGTETSSVIFSDSGFLNDSDKLNCIEILKDAGYPEDNLLTI
ncbi:site-specific DNA-methyltransferase [Exiguobacterium sp.]|uniref:site-specific DNA-methyltransferase n=1 Tax=Exiguobacterium sp. TaxID=44751 RepID=UPI002898DED6|nr:site-specific DNA-methyltransferase [Exiguobacterium sp.]